MCDPLCDWCESAFNRLYKYSGLALATVTHLLFYFGIWAANRLGIFYWFATEKFDQ